MRPVREITSEEENFRMVSFGEPSEKFFMIKRDSIEPEPIGTIVLMAFRITGYNPDCDGSLMAQLEQINKGGEETGWCPSGLGLWPDCDLVVSLEEFQQMFQK